MFWRLSCLRACSALLLWYKNRKLTAVDSNYNFTASLFLVKENFNLAFPILMTIFGQKKVFVHFPCILPRGLPYPELSILSPSLEQSLRSSFNIVLMYYLNWHTYLFLFIILYSSPKTCRSILFLHRLTYTYVMTCSNICWSVAIATSWKSQRLPKGMNFKQRSQWL